MLLNKLIKWILKNTDKELFSPKDLIQSGIFSNYTSEELASAIQELVKQGIIFQYYRVIRPDGSLYPTNYDDPRHIPDTLPDGEPTSGMDITTVFYI